MENEVLVEVDFCGQVLQVTKRPDPMASTWTLGRALYDLSVGGEIRHPGLDAEGAIRALGHYMQGCKK